MLICDHWLYAFFMRQSSERKRKILERPVVAYYICVYVCACVDSLRVKCISL